MYVFYSEKSRDSKIFVSKLLNIYKDIKYFSIEQYPDVVRKFNLSKIPTVIKKDNTRLEGQNCSILISEKKYLKYNNLNKNTIGVNNHKKIATPTTDEAVERLKNGDDYPLLPVTGLLGQQLTKIEATNNQENYQSGNKEKEREDLDSELKETFWKK